MGSKRSAPEARWARDGVHHGNEIPGLSSERSHVNKAVRALPIRMTTPCHLTPQ